MSRLLFRTGIAAALVLVAACDGPQSGTGGGMSGRPEEAPASPPTASVGRAADEALAVRPASLPSQAVADSAAPRMLIRTGDASIEIDSLEAAVEQVRGLAERLGGFVASTSYQGGRDRMREAMLELRIPADRFEAAESGLDSIGELEWLNVNVQDVGEESVDLSARMANSRRLETRLVELLASRTGKLEDVLAVERELARVREEIERYEGRLRFLRTRVAMSTLSVRLHEPAPIIGGTGSTGVIGEAFRQAWRNFVAAVAGLIAASGILVPLLAVAIGGWLLIRRFGRRTRTSPTTGEPGER
ncbi:MAG TPA: DUF4349 domain-containing protein [Gemmatimonadales bacterium]